MFFRSALQRWVTRAVPWGLTHARRAARVEMSPPVVYLRKGRGRRGGVWETARWRYVGWDSLRGERKTVLAAHPDGTVQPGLSQGAEAPDQECPPSTRVSMWQVPEQPCKSLTRAQRSSTGNEYLTALIFNVTKKIIQKRCSQRHKYFIFPETHGKTRAIHHSRNSAKRTKRVKVFFWGG